MKINSSTFTSSLSLTLFAGVMAWGIYWIYKSNKQRAAIETENKRLFLEHKSEALAEKCVSDDIDKASISNEGFEVDDRVKAKKLLMYQLSLMEAARDIDEFDKQLSKLYDLIKSFTTGGGDQQAAFLNYAWDEHLARQAQRDKLEARQQEDKQTDRIARALENGARTIASVNRSVSQIQNAIPSGNGFHISLSN